MLLRLYAMSSALVELTNNIVFTHGDNGAPQRAATLLAKQFGFSTVLINPEWSSYQDVQLRVLLNTKHSREAKAFLDLMAVEYPLACGRYVDKEISYKEHEAAALRASRVLHAPVSIQTFERCVTQRLGSPHWNKV